MPVPVLFAALAKAGLGLLGNAVLAKGKQVIEDKIGIKIPDDPAALQDPAVVKELQQAQFAHEEFLVEAALREKELEIEAEKAGQQQVTERWKFDMSSDSWLSKNIRPGTLAYWTVAITLLIIIDSIGDWVDINELWIDLIKYSYMTILAAYFVGRGAEKATSMVTKMKEKLNVAKR